MLVNIWEVTQNSNYLRGITHRSSGDKEGHSFKSNVTESASEASRVELLLHRSQNLPKIISKNVNLNLSMCVIRDIPEVKIWHLTNLTASHPVKERKFAVVALLPRLLVVVLA